ncbi:hypothetical protein EG352_19880 [Chryseobacterium indologenes]|uniref:Uncharacterized protein n=1 Tax=Chryseobacterium indologenes TaxID=253 RepID=A0AAD1DXE4_CHRID|nr:hypothetical protein EG352_19880 [Chryseobacterium indologenes]
MTLVQKLERSEVSKFSFTQDLYWNIPVDESFNVYEEPKLTIGSITEDWEFLEKILDNDREALNFDLCKVSAILKLISVSTL